MLSTPPASLTNPLQTLVMHELHEIRRSEDILQNRLANLSGQSDENGAVDIGWEVESLQRRADRLSRLIDAMGSLFAFEPAEAVS
jgi:hypothetical protein